MSTNQAHLPAFLRLGICALLCAAYRDTRVSAAPGDPLSIINYVKVSQEGASGNQAVIAYRADLVNPGFALANATATLTTLDPATIRVVPGQSSLLFAGVPANSQVTSTNTFKILTDPTVPLDVTKLLWTFQSTPAPPIANGGPDRIVLIDSTVNLDGRLSTNPGGVGSLTYHWTFLSRPPGTSQTRLTFLDTPTTSFVPDALGDFVVELTVTNGVSTTKTQITITVVLALPSLTSISPDIGRQGSVNLRLDITGQNTHFGPGTTASFGPGIAVGGGVAGGFGPITAPGLTSAFALVTIAADAALGAHDVTVRTGIETATSIAAFTVVSGNKAPVVNAGPDLTAVVFPSGAALNGTVSDDGVPTGSALTVTWSKVSGPGAVTFGSLNSVATTASFCSTGTYVLRLTASDSQLSSSDDVVVTVTAPAINVGDLIVTDPSAFNSPEGKGAIFRIDPTSGTQTVIARSSAACGIKLGYPAGAAVASNGDIFFTDWPISGGAGVWKLDRATGAVIEVPSAEKLGSPTGIAIESSGTLLVADDSLGALIRIEPTTGKQTVLSSGGRFAAPRGVAIAPNGEIYVVDRAAEGGHGAVFRIVPANGTQTHVSTGGNFSSLSGIAIDPNGQILVADFSSAPVQTKRVIRVNPNTGEQTVISSGGEFGSPFGIAIAANGDIFVADSYTNPAPQRQAAVLRVSPVTGSQDLVSVDGVLLDPMGIAVYYLNRPPSVTAGPDISVTLPALASLTGSISDDGLPAGGSLSSTWSKASGPGTVTFTDFSLAVTTAAFSQSGVYLLRLTANDGQLRASDEVVVSVLPALITVPTVVGLTQSAATAAVTAVGLVVGSVTTQPSITVPAGNVISQNPVAATQVTSGSAVNLMVSSGPPEVAVPNVVGLTQAAATTAIAGAGLVVGTTAAQASATVPAGIIINQNPAAATQVAVGSVVNLVVSSGPAQVVVPNVVGLSQAAATTAIAGVGLVLGTVTTQPSATVPPGSVISQNPAAATHVSVGSAVNLVVSSGPAQVVVPNAVGLTQAAATSAITGVGLVLGTVTTQSSATVPTGSVISQNPSPATLVAVGSAVNLVVSSGPAQVVVPNVVGLTQAAATTAITGVRLVLGAVTTQPSATVPLGSIISQNPVGGTQVASGSTVNFVVSSGPAALVSAAPNTGMQGASIAVTITGLNTHFVQSITKIRFGAGISVGGGIAGDLGPVTVTSPTTATAQLMILGSALPAQRTITAQTGSELASLANGFAVAGLPYISSVTPPTGQRGQSGSVTILGQYTNFVQNTTQASFGAGISVGGAAAGSFGPVTVTGPFTATANIAIDAVATLGLRTVNVKTGAEQASAPNSFSVLGPVTGVPPVVSISSPVEAAEVSTPTTVTGTVTSPNIDQWTLDYQPVGGSIWKTFASGATSAVSGTFDPTALLNGNVMIRLTALDLSGQATSTTVTVVVTKNQKIGNFTVAFNDLSVPVAGIPIQVVRRYDSRQRATNGDFGFGWTLDLKTVRTTENVALGAQWVQTHPSGLASYCIAAAKPHIVTVAFPDGTTYEFSPTLTPNCQSPFIGPISVVTIGYTPTGTTPPNVHLAIAGNNTVPVNGTLGPVTFFDPNNFGTFDPDQYRLTLPDGRTLQISMQSGLQSMTDLNGNKLTVTPAGITSSTGKSVTFVRDGSGRITQMTDPALNVYKYAYDGSGNLVSFTDPIPNNSTYTYDSSHRLLAIKDPRNVQPIRNDYDVNGLLVSHTDAFGYVINYTHNTGSRQEIVTDRLNNITVNEYDQDGNIVKVTDARGGITARVYDAFGNITKETNAIGKSRSYTYDTNNNRSSETDPLLKTITYTYNSRNQLVTIKDPLNRLTTNVYDPATGNLTSTTDADLKTTTYLYDSRGLRIQMTDPILGVTKCEYDAFGNLSKQTDALNNITTYTYDANGNRKTETKTRTAASGVETLLTQYDYDALNRLIKTTYPDSSFTQIQYNEIGKQSVTTDTLGRQTQYQYDLMGRLIQTIYADGKSESIAYDAEGDRVTSTDRGGRITTYVYDELKRLSRTIYADNTSTSTTYDAIGQVIAVTDTGSNTTQYTYDDAGRRTNVTDALLHETAFEYDDAGNQIKVTDANGHVTRYQYDSLNRRTKTIYDDGTSDSVGYDAIGRTVSKTDQDNKATQFLYDKLGRLLQVTDALLQNTSYAYDEVGNRISQTDANLHTTKFEYDKLGRRTKRTLPLGQSETFTYYSDGSVKTRTDFNGKTTNYQYDPVGRLSAKVPDASFAAPTVSFTYTDSGQRLSMSDVSGATAYSYDLRDRPTQKATPQGTLAYTYDGAGNLMTIRSSNTNGTSVDYGYDHLNRLSTAKDNRLATGTTSYTYDNVGKLQGYLYPNGLQTDVAFDPLNRLKTLTIAKGSTVASYDYVLGPSGNRTQVTELSGRVVKYQYDALYRLTTEAITGATINGTIGYVYDSVGNRQQRTSTVTPVPAATYTYDTNDRLTTDTYDANGNTTATGTAAYVYDFESHLIAQGGPTPVTLVYDGDGNRVAKTVGGVTTRYLVDDRNLTGYAQVIEELSGGTVQRVYTYGLHRISQSQASGTSFYGFDGHGSVRLLTDTTGAVTDRYDYDAFGNVISQSGTTPNVYLYSGEQNDPSLGLYYLRARYLNSNSGRFFSFDPLYTLEDSIDLDDSPLPLHKYAYADADPVDKTDPGGLFAGIAEIALTTSIINTLPLPQRIPTTSLFHRTEAASIELSTAGAEVSYRELQGRLAAGPPPYFKRPELGAGQIRVDPDGISTFEYPHLPDPTDRQYAVGFFFHVTTPKETNKGPYDIISLPGCEATYTPDPPNKPGHWSINCATDTKATIAAYVKRNYLLGLRFPPFFITLPGWHGIPQERHFGDPGH